jgi:beta-phosphoglucomutase family hydrolase
MSLRRPGRGRSRPATGGPRTLEGVLGIPDHSRCCLFDLDGVLTQTASVHDAAWKEMFDDFLRRWGERTGQRYAPFDSGADYERYVDGKARADGTRSFLAARGIELPEGSDQDPPGDFTVAGLSAWKNELVLRHIDEDGVAVYPGSVRYLAAVRQAGLPRAVVSASANTRSVLRSAGLSGQFDVVVDGLVARREGLAGKPAPDTYRYAARQLGVPPGDSVVYEDAQAGVAAGRAGGFGWVVGVDRVGQAAELRASGADIVVPDLADLLDAP